jgi:hypothetical protein
LVIKSDWVRKARCRMINVTLIQTKRLRIKIVLMTKDIPIPTSAREGHSELLEAREIPMFSMCVGRSQIRN